MVSSHKRGQALNCRKLDYEAENEYSPWPYIQAPSYFQTFISPVLQFCRAAATPKGLIAQCRGKSPTKPPHLRIRESQM